MYCDGHNLDRFDTFAKKSGLRYSIICSMYIYAVFSLTDLKYVMYIQQKQNICLPIQVI